VYRYRTFTELTAKFGADQALLDRHIAIHERKYKIVFAGEELEDFPRPAPGSLGKYPSGKKDVVESLPGKMRRINEGNDIALGRAVKFMTGILKFVFESDDAWQLVTDINNGVTSSAVALLSVSASGISSEGASAGSSSGGDQYDGVAVTDSMTALWGTSKSKEWTSNQPALAQLAGKAVSYAVAVYRNKKDKNGDKKSGETTTAKPAAKSSAKSPRTSSSSKPASTSKKPAAKSASTSKSTSTSKTGLANKGEIEDDLHYVSSNDDNITVSSTDGETQTNFNKLGV
jgi:hypothetical protein